MDLESTERTRSMEMEPNDTLKNHLKSNLKDENKFCSRTAIAIACNGKKISVYKTPAIY